MGIGSILPIKFSCNYLLSSLNSYECLINHLSNYNSSRVLKIWNYVENINLSSFLFKIALHLLFHDFSMLD